MQSEKRYLESYPFRFFPLPPPFHHRPRSFPLLSRLMITYRAERRALRVCSGRAKAGRQAPHLRVYTYPLIPPCLALPAGSRRKDVCCGGGPACTAARWRKWWRRWQHKGLTSLAGFGQEAGKARVAWRAVVGTLLLRKLVGAPRARGGKGLIPAVGLIMARRWLA